MKASPGKKRVDIWANQKTGKTGPYGEPAVVAIIPEKYNTHSELTAEVHETELNTITLEQ